MLVNDFRIGADPEFVFLKPPSLVNHTHLRARATAEVPLYGPDHQGWVIEPHPVPEFSCRQVTRNIKVSLNQIARAFSGDFKWRAGAFINAPERTVTLGGHVHFDRPRLSIGAIRALDAIAQAFETLDILPSKECAERRDGGYGRPGDLRYEHGHCEYRSMCSWLFSQKTTLLCLTAAKLGVVAPEVVPTTMTSYAAVQKWLEGFKGHDDDVDWILDRDYFGKTLEARPDRDIQNVWHVDPANTDGVPEAQPRQAIERALREAQATQGLVPPTARALGFEAW